ncbi:MAG: hypothetical protein ACI33M_08520 [Lysinibacillus sp.]
MLKVPCKQLAESLDMFCEKVCDEKEVIEILLPEGKNAVLIPYEDYEKMMITIEGPLN